MSEPDVEARRPGRPALYERKDRDRPEVIWLTPALDKKWMALARALRLTPNDALNALIDRCADLIKVRPPLPESSRRGPRTLYPDKLVRRHATYTVGVRAKVKRAAKRVKLSKNDVVALLLDRYAVTLQR